MLLMLLILCVCCQGDDEEEGPPGPAPSPANSGTGGRPPSPPFSRPPGACRPRAMRATAMLQQTARVLQLDLWTALCKRHQPSNAKFAGRLATAKHR